MEAMGLTNRGEPLQIIQETETTSSAATRRQFK